jgi:hypothetical protein
LLALAPVLVGGRGAVVVGCFWFVAVTTTTATRMTMTSGCFLETHLGTRTALLVCLFWLIIFYFVLGFAG